MMNVEVIHEIPATLELVRCTGVTKDGRSYDFEQLRVKYDIDEYPLKQNGELDVNYKSRNYEYVKFGMKTLAALNH